MSDPTDPGDGAEVELRGYLQVLRRRWRTIALVALGFLVLSLVLSLQQEKQYTASAKLLIEPSSTENIFTGNESEAYLAFQNADRRLNNEVLALTSGSTRKAVEQVYDGPLDPGSVTASISAAMSDAVTVKASGPDADEVARLVNEYVDTFISVRREQRIAQLVAAGAEVQQQIDDLSQRIASVRQPLTAIEADLAGDPRNSSLVARADDLAEQLAPELDPLENQRAFYQQALEDLRVQSGIVGTSGARVLTEAEAPTQPSAPTPVRTGILAVFLGSIVGLGVAFVRDALDERVRTLADLDRIAPGIPTLAIIPEGPPKTDRNHVALRDDPRSSLAEAFRTLRTSVKFAQVDRDLRVIQVTSAVAGEGKSTVVANLAIALARGGERVAVVCCDLRRPTIQQRLRVPLTPGLSDVLLQTVPLGEALQEVEPRLYVLAAGTPPPNPSELLSSDRANKVILAFESDFDIVLIDSTPLLPVTDALVASRFADATILVLDSKSAKRRALRQAVTVLSQVSAPLLGLVVNRAEDSGAFDFGYGYGYGYGALDSVDDPRGAPEKAPLPTG